MALSCSFFFCQESPRTQASRAFSSGDRSSLQAGTDMARQNKIKNRCICGNLGRRRKRIGSRINIFSRPYSTTLFPCEPKLDWFMLGKVIGTLQKGNIPIVECSGGQREEI